MTTFEQHRIANRLFLFLLAGMFLLFFLVGLGAAELVRLAWDASADHYRLRTYRMYERCSEAALAPELHAPFTDYTEVGLVTNWQTTVDANRFYYFCVTAVDTEGLESDGSNTVLMMFVRGPVVELAPWLMWNGEAGK